MRAGRCACSTICSSHPSAGRRAAIAQPIAAPFSQPEPGTASLAISQPEPVAVSQSEPFAPPFAVYQSEPATAASPATASAAAATP